MVKWLWLTIFCRPHPNECSGGDLDGDLFSISWDKGLIPPQMATPMDYSGRRARIMDHDVTLEVMSNLSVFITFCCQFAFF